VISKALKKKKKGKKKKLSFLSTSYKKLFKSRRTRSITNLSTPLKET